MKWKKEDLFALICLIVLVLGIVIDGVTAQLGANAGAKAGEIPADAVTLTGSAPGINGDVVVEIVATADRIYRIRVVTRRRRTVSARWPCPRCRDGSTTPRACRWTL